MCNRRSFCMRRAFGLILSLLALASLVVRDAQAITPNKPGLATITASVRNYKGNPLAGALEFLLKEGAKQTVKEAMTDRHGNLDDKLISGRCGVSTITHVFSEVVFTSVEV